MNSYLIASVKSIMSDLFRSWPREGLCVYVSGLSLRGMRDVLHRTTAYTYPQRAAYQPCLARVFAEAQMLLLDIKKRILKLKISALYSLLYFLVIDQSGSLFFQLSFTPYTPCVNILDNMIMYILYCVHIISCKVKKGPALTGLVLLPKSRQPNN